MPKKNNIAEEIIYALKQLNGAAPLADIYDECQKYREEHGINIPDNHSASIRAALQKRSSDSIIFDGKNDLFEHIDVGVWGLRNFDQKTFSSKERKDIPRPEQKAIEGELIERKYFARKRNQSIVKACKERDSYTCQSCQFYYNDKIVECHHLKPMHMSSLKEVAAEELLTLCPNCHRLAHELLREDKKLQNKNALLDALANIRRA